MDLYPEEVLHAALVFVAVRTADPSDEINIEESRKAEKDVLFIGKEKILKAIMQ